MKSLFWSTTNSSPLKMAWWFVIPHRHNYVLSFSKKIHLFFYTFLLREAPGYSPLPLQVPVVEKVWGDTEKPKDMLKWSKRASWTTLKAAGLSGSAPVCSLAMDAQTTITGFLWHWRKFKKHESSQASSAASFFWFPCGFVEVCSGWTVKTLSSECRSQTESYQLMSVLRLVDAWLWEWQRFLISLLFLSCRMFTSITDHNL